MSIDPSPTSTEETPEQEENAPVRDSKMKAFLSEKAQPLTIAGIVIMVLFLVGVLFFTFFYESKMERFADDFCECADKSDNSSFNYSKDGFGYKSDISTCFGMEFSAYGQDFDKVSKRTLLKEFKEAVVKKCPEKLEKVFEY
ncbi:MAG: hypothetical protein AB8E82_08540 [Aureispira sp.]